MNKFIELFERKPIIGMLHLNSYEKDTLNTAIEEIEILKSEGIDAVLVENYFGSIKNVIEVLDYLNKTGGIIYGVNILGDFKRAFKEANKYNASFIQIDSVSGHLSIEEDKFFEEELMSHKIKYDIPVIGGVRFKYQKVASSRSLEDDLKAGMKRCEAIAVTGTRTGEETPLSKLKSFRKIVNDFPLIIAAGLTVENASSLEYSQGAIVGSYIKENHVDYGKVSKENTRKLINKVNTYRI